jgi:hypothetical protein
MVSGNIFLGGMSFDGYFRGGLIVRIWTGGHLANLFRAGTDWQYSMRKRKSTWQASQFAI